MSDIQDVADADLPSRSIDVPRSSTRHRSTIRRRGGGSSSPQVRRLFRTSTPVTSTPKPRRRTSQPRRRPLNISYSSSSAIGNSQSIAPPLPSPMSVTNVPPSQHQVSLHPFDVSSGNERDSGLPKTTTTRSGKLKKAAVLSHFTLRPDGRYECNSCHSVCCILSWLSGKHEFHRTDLKDWTGEWKEDVSSVVIGCENKHSILSRNARINASPSSLTIIHSLTYLRLSCCSLSFSNVS